MPPQADLTGVRRPWQAIISTRLRFQHPFDGAHLPGIVPARLASQAAGEMHRIGLTAEGPCPVLMRALCARPASEWLPYAVRASSPALIELEAIGMADVIYLAVGGGAFLAFAVLAVLLKRV